MLLMVIRPSSWFSGAQQAQRRPTAYTGMNEGLNECWQVMTASCSKQLQRVAGGSYRMSMSACAVVSARVKSSQAAGRGTMKWYLQHSTWKPDAEVLHRHAYPAHMFDEEAQKFTCNNANAVCMHVAHSR